jgi:hypothetical protein
MFLEEIDKVSVSSFIKEFLLHVYVAGVIVHDNIFVMLRALQVFFVILNDMDFPYHDV